MQYIKVDTSYKIVRCEVEKVVDVIKTMTDEGWELITVVAFTVCDRELYFKRHLL